MWFRSDIWNISYIELRIWNQVSTSRYRCARSRVQTPLKSWLFQASIRNWLNCVHNCDDHSLLDFSILLTVRLIWQGRHQIIFLNSLKLIQRLVYWITGWVFHCICLYWFIRTRRPATVVDLFSERTLNTDSMLILSSLFSFVVFLFSLFIDGMVA